MSRGLERKLLLAGSSWNLFTSLVTIFSYYTWFRKEGFKRFEDADWDAVMAGAHVIDSVSHVILTFGLFVFVGSIVNFLVAVKLKDCAIQYGVLSWIGFWSLVQFLSMDVVGFALFLTAFVTYLARNKAVKLSREILSERGM